MRVLMMIVIASILKFSFLTNVHFRYQTMADEGCLPLATSSHVQRFFLPFPKNCALIWLSIMVILKNYSL